RMKVLSKRPVNTFPMPEGTAQKSVIRKLVCLAWARRLEWRAQAPVFRKVRARRISGAEAPPEPHGRDSAAKYADGPQRALPTAHTGRGAHLYLRAHGL